MCTAENGAYNSSTMIFMLESSAISLDTTYDFVKYLFLFSS